MSPIPTGSFDPLDGIIAEYLQAVEACNAPTRESVLARHPEQAERLRLFFRDFDAVGRDASKFRLPASSRTAETITHDRAGSVQLPKLHYLGDYELQSEIARGGMGVVYRAKQVSLNRPVAVKMILAGTYATPVAVQRFRAEAEAAANLDHPNILPIYEVGEHEEHQYFSMKLVEGGSLSSRIDDLKSKPKQIAELMTTLARAVHFAHQRGILHRDLKPANVLLDADGTPYVTDFGLAKKVDADDGSTRTGSIVGTPSYMAPEQARGEKGLTTSVDVYSLGAILYEMLTGEPPFRGGTIFETVNMVLEQEPAKPKGDRDLVTIALKCLSKDSANRYASAGELADDLDRYTRGEAITARPVGRVERATMWVKRNKAVAALATTVLLAVVVGTGISLRYAVIADRRAAEALEQKAAVEFREESIKDLLANMGLEQAKSTRMVGGAGWKTKSAGFLDIAIRNTLRPRHAQVKTEDLPSLADLRGEAINASARIDCELKREIPRSALSRLFYSGDGRRQIVKIRTPNPLAFLGGMRIHDLQTGETLVSRDFTLTEMADHSRIDWLIAVDHEGKRGLYSVANQALRMIDLETQRDIRSLPISETKSIEETCSEAHFSPDGRWVAAAFSGPQSIRWFLWHSDGKSPPVLLQEKKLEPGEVLDDSFLSENSLGFSPDSKSLLLISSDRLKGNLYDLAGDKTKPETWFTSEGFVRGFVWRPDSRAIALSTAVKPTAPEARVSLCERASASPESAEGIYRGRVALAFCRDGQRLAIGSRERAEVVSLIDTASGRLIGGIQTNRTDGHLIDQLVWTPMDELITCHTLMNTQVWSISEVEQQWKTISGFRCGDIPIASPCGRRLLLTADAAPEGPAQKKPFGGILPIENTQCAMIDLKTGRLLWKHKIEYPEKLVFSPDGERIAYTGPDEAYVLDSATGKLVASYKAADKKAGASLQTVFYSPTGVLLSVVELEGDKPLQVLELETGKVLGDLPPRPVMPNSVEEEPVLELPSWTVYSSPDGTRLFTRAGTMLEKTISTENYWNVIEVPSLKKLASFPSGREIMPPMVQSSRDGARLIAMFIPMQSKEGVNISKSFWTCWDAQTGKTLIQPSEYQDLALASISPDGRWIASVDDFANVVVWKVDDGKQFARWKPFDGGRIGIVYFTTDGILNITNPEQESVLRLDWDTMRKQLARLGLVETP